MVPWQKILIFTPLQIWNLQAFKAGYNLDNFRFVCDRDELNSNAYVKRPQDKADFRIPSIRTPEEKTFLPRRKKSFNPVWVSN